MKTAEIRDAFLTYFADQGHEVVASSSLIPANDPTLLFTNAGMVQFKDVFLGRDQRAYRRAATSQRCVRAGGKHNDLDNVGYTARHHTFFEMLGNFSFGDYFKAEAIRFAWTFLTDVLQLPKEKLWVTVYHEDAEAEQIWLNEVGVDPARLSRLGEDSNFWQMGDTGPCGPCTEIFYDHGADVWGGPPGSPEEDGDRYIEIWNLVFMQFDRQSDGSLAPLPSPSIDTGMGLERLAAVLQGVHSNYEIDLFQNLLKAAAEVIGTADLTQQSLRVIADHIRSCAFLIVDGVVPSNEGRGYVLRRILRRAVRHGNKLGADGLFFHQLVQPLVAEMGSAYPELAAAAERVADTIRREEEQFARTLDQGLRILEQDLEGMSGTEIPGDVVFKLYDTYGFPADLTADIARERGLTLDMPGFEAAMAAQKQRSKESGKFQSDYHAGLKTSAATQFNGYERETQSAAIVELYVDGEAVEGVQAGQEAVIVLDETPFYAESGGQVGDVGLIATASARFEVADTTKAQQAHLHHGLLVAGELTVGDTVEATVTPEQRQAIRLNHSATHLLHAALREILGDHVIQKGSLVTASRLRFDFTHPEAISAQQMHTIEQRVNQQIRANTAVTTELMPIDEAKARGAMALFGEKYDDVVRVLTMGNDNFSVELCGGTHVARTGDIGLLVVISEGGVAAGIRRIEAVTGANALDYVQSQSDSIQAAATVLKTGRDQFLEKLKQTQEKVRQLEKQLEKQQAQLAASAGDAMVSQATDVAGVAVIATVLEGADSKALKETVDRLKNKLGSGIVVLGARQGDKASLVAGVTKDLIGRVKAGELVNHAASHMGGRGGGRPDMAMAGGPEVDKLDHALAQVIPWLQAKLAEK